MMRFPAKQKNNPNSQKGHISNNKKNKESHIQRNEPVKRSPSREGKENQEPVLFEPTSSEDFLAADAELRESAANKKSRRQSLGRRVSFSQTVDVRKFQTDFQRKPSGLEEGEEEPKVKVLARKSVGAIQVHRIEREEEVRTPKAVFPKNTYEDVVQAMKKASSPDGSHASLLSDESSRSDEAEVTILGNDDMQLTGIIPHCSDRFYDQDSEEPKESTHPDEGFEITMVGDDTVANPVVLDSMLLL
eukprot:TRINITY_DN5557_c0_g1_i5.p1 TRINITY_DN5557_c0_g1~~TRINITY_DN5557_c0_g1_i5.p1  ORF type:complete len:246 (+),score=77.63 TRINITY_DN5557_c0_g1_i5:187-924(+)